MNIKQIPWWVWLIAAEDGYRMGAAAPRLGGGSQTESRRNEANRGDGLCRELLQTLLIDVRCNKDGPMRFILLTISLTALATPAWSFGFTAGAPIEEASGSDPGAQPYRPVDRCHLVVVRDRHGRRVKIRRCR
jgi:hypothetical protein